MRIALFERTKHHHEQCSFRFLAERHNALANGTLAKRFVGETTGHRPERDFFPLPIFPRALMFIAVFLAVFIGIPSGSLCWVGKERGSTQKFFFYHRKKIHWLTFHKRPPLTTGLAIEMLLSLVKLKGCPWHTLFDALKVGGGELIHFIHFSVLFL